MWGFLLKLSLPLRARLPRREWTAEGQLWVQYVSSTPATRLDVINLQVGRVASSGCVELCVAAPKESQFVGCKPRTAHPCAPLASSLWLVCLLSASLQEQLDQKLQQRQARETGICPIREELYAQCFGTSVALASP